MLSLGTTLTTSIYHDPIQKCRQKVNFFAYKKVVTPNHPEKMAPRVIVCLSLLLAGSCSGPTRQSPVGEWNRIMVGEGRSPYAELIFYRDGRCKYLSLEGRWRYEGDILLMELDAINKPLVDGILGQGSTIRLRPNRGTLQLLIQRRGKETVRATYHRRELL